MKVVSKLLSTMRTRNTQSKIRKIRFYMVVFPEAAYIISSKRGKVFTTPPSLEFLKGWRINRAARWIETSGGSIKPLLNKST